MTVSEREQLQTMDFEQMSAAQIAAAKAEIRRLRLPLDLRRTRRLRPDPAGPRIDLRGHAAHQPAPGRRDPATWPRSAGWCGRRRWSCCATSRARWRAMRRCCCISCTPWPTTATGCTCSCSAPGCPTSPGSCATATPRWRSRWSPHAVPDWSGGTRIGEALAEFNRRWAKRVLGQGAVVLLVTDGLDRDGAAGLAENMDRLHRSCRRLIWLNPLLRWEGFQPKSQGIRAMLPHVDEFRTVHNLDSLRALIDLLSRPAPRARRDLEMERHDERGRRRAGHRRRLAGGGRDRWRSRP